MEPWRHGGESSLDWLGRRPFAGRSRAARPSPTFPSFASFLCARFTLHKAFPGIPAEGADPGLILQLA